MKVLFDESLSPRLVPLLSDLFPESESALRNGLARIGDRKILEYAAAHVLFWCRIRSRYLHHGPSADVTSIRAVGRQ
jgi:hypothetical protein